MLALFAGSVEIIATVYYISLHCRQFRVVRSSEEILFEYFLFHENWRCVPSSVDDCLALCARLRPKKTFERTWIAKLLVESLYSVLNDYLFHVGEIHVSLIL